MTSPDAILSRSALLADERAALLAERQGLLQTNRFLAERIDALMNVHHAAILIIDPETGAIIDGNHAAVRRYAAGRPELLSRNIREINTLAPDEIAERMRLAVAARRHHFEFSHRLRDGTIQEVDVYSGPIFYDGKIALISFIHDATRRKTLERKLKALASTDHLTGCCNRRRCFSILRREFRQSRRNGAPLTLAMIDLDHFKQINDCHGHPGGDLVLKGLATAFSAFIRESDSLGRLGGEEFCIVFPNTALDDALPVLARVREAAEDFRMHLPTGDAGATISIGVSSLLPDDADETPLLKRADTALYTAKENGRNRIEVVCR